MGWTRRARRQEFLISAPRGIPRRRTPVALAITRPLEVGLLMDAAAKELKSLALFPFAPTARSLRWPHAGHTGMFDSLPFRNDAASVFRRLIRSLPTRRA